MHFARAAQFFLISKKQHYRLILYISLPLFCTTTTRFMEKMLYVVLFNFFSLPFIFSLVAASISPFFHSRYKSVYMFFFQRNWSPLVLSFAIALCLLSKSMQTLKSSRQKESAFVVVVFISKGWTHGLTDPVPTIFSEPQFLGCIDLPNFLTHVAPLHALRVLESSANTDEDNDDDDQNNNNNKQQIIESLVYQFSRRA